MTAWTLKDVADFTGLSADAVYARARAREIPVKDLRRAGAKRGVYRFDPAEIRAWWERLTKQPNRTSRRLALAIRRAEAAAERAGAC